MANLADLWLAVERFRQACERDARVAAAFLGGSLAAGRADAHSDLDLYAIAAADAAPSLVRDAAAFVAAFGEPVLVELSRDFEGLGFDMLHFVLADGICGEVAIAAPGALARLHGGAHRVLVDKTGILRGVEFPLARASREQRRAEVERALRWFWLYAIALSKALARGQVWIAHDRLEKLRACLRTLLAGADLGAAQAAAHERALAESVVAPERTAQSAAARSLLDTYRALARAAASRFDVEQPHALARVAAAKLEAVLTPARR